MTRAERRLHPIAVKWLPALLGALLLWWLLHQMNWADLGTRAIHVPIWLWLASALGLVCSHVLRAGRLRCEWAGVLHLSWPAAWALLVRHSAWVVLMPMRAGEAAYVWALHRQGGVSLAQAGLSLLRLRVQDVFVLCAMASAVWLPLPWLARGATLFGMLFLGVWLAPQVWQRLVVRRWPGTAVVAPRTGARLSWASWLYALGNWLVKLAALALPVCSLAQLSPEVAWGAALGGEFGAALPFQPPAGLGPYEAGAWGGAALAAHVATQSAPLTTDLAAAALLVHMLALAVTTTSALVAYLTGWADRPFPSITPVT